MQDVNPGKWGSWTHEVPTTNQSEEPRDNPYDMYPGNWAVASETARDTEEVRQRRSRETNGGMGFASDYGEGYTTPLIVPERPLSAGVALVGAAVRLG